MLKKFSFTRRAILKTGATTLVACNGLRGSAAQANALHVGKRAPPATLVTFQNQTLSTRDLLGDVVILTFWATWCSPCREELPLLSNYAQRHANDGLHMLGFCLDTPDKLREATQIAQSLSFPNGLYNKSSAPGYGRIWRLPVNFTIDREGNLIDNGWKEKPPAWTAERLQRIVTPLLKLPS